MLTACGGEESDKQASLDTAAESVTSPAAPIARIENTTDTHWGVEVEDPYRYMEDHDKTRNTKHNPDTAVRGYSQPAGIL